MHRPPIPGRPGWGLPTMKRTQALHGRWDGDFASPHSSTLRRAPVSSGNSASRKPERTAGCQQAEGQGRAGQGVQELAQVPRRPAHQPPSQDGPRHELTILSPGAGGRIPLLTGLGHRGGAMPPRRLCYLSSCPGPQRQEHHREGPKDPPGHLNFHSNRTLILIWGSQSPSPPISLISL